MADIVLSSPQHEQFVTEYLFGGAKGNAARAYANVYYDGNITNSCYSSASKLLTRTDIQDYISVQMEQQKKIAEYRKIHNVQMLSDIADEMITAQPLDHNGQPLSTHLCRQTAIKAIVEQNKMLGLNEEKANVNIDNTGASFTFNLIAPSDEDEDEIRREMESIRKEQGDTEDIDFEDLEE